MGDGSDQPHAHIGAQDLEGLSVAELTGLLAEKILSLLPDHGPLYALLRSFYEVPFYHLVLEGILVILILRLMCARSYSISERRDKLSQKEIDELVADWEPEPLVPPVTNRRDLELPIIDGKVGTHVSINGGDKINLGTFNFLGLIGDADIENSAIKTLRKYGVGSCGPRGFYGTIDVHLDLEQKLAEFMKTEEAIIYSYGFSTIASAIPAYSKRGDVLFCDDGVSFPVQKGIDASRSDVRWFPHNDMQALEKLLIAYEDELKKSKKGRVARTFIIIEGLYANYGDIAPLAKIVELKYKYKVRIFMDESMSFGVLGKTGRGITEHLGVKVTDIDMICASMEASLGSIGGFCCGKTFVIDHQRLSGQGYCFSASLPPILATAAIEGLGRITPQALTTLSARATKLRQRLSTLSQVTLGGAKESPIIHMRLAKSKGSRDADEDALQAVVDAAMAAGVALTRAKYIVGEEQSPPAPSIRITVSAKHTDAELDKAADATIAAVVKVLGN